MKAILTVGMSGSGKTTWASQQQGLLNISRDEIRFPNGQVDWGEWTFSPENEERVSVEQDHQIDNAAALGLDIIISDTNLNKYLRNRLIRRLESLGYEVTLKIFPITLEEAISRDSNRGTASVGEEVLRKQFSNWRKFLIYYSGGGHVADSRRSS